MLNVATYVSGRFRGGPGGPGPPFGKVKKCKRAPLTENDVLRSRKRKILRYYPPPPPPNRVGFWRPRKNSATTPPPTESRRHGTSHESGPPPWENPGSATVCDGQDRAPHFHVCPRMRARSCPTQAMFRWTFRE